MVYHTTGETRLTRISPVCLRRTAMKEIDESPSVCTLNRHRWIIYDGSAKSHAFSAEVKTFQEGVNIDE